MDPAEIRLIQKVVIKERGQKFFLEKSARPQYFASPLNLQRRTVMAIRHLTVNLAVMPTPLRLRLWFYIVQGLANTQ
jgi:hypothetical protein